MKIFKNKSNAKQVEEYYSNWTLKYIESFGDTFQASRPDNLDSFFSYLIKSIDIKDGLVVVDAGCGIGGPLINMSEKVNANFIGLNVSNQQIQIAKSKLSDMNNKRVEFFECDFHDLSSLSLIEPVDRIYFLESMVHSNDTQKVIREAHSVLKPYGKIYIKDLFERVPVSKEDKLKIKRSVKINNKLFCLKIQPKEQILQELRDCGFKLDFCKQLEIETNQNVGNNFIIKNNLVKHESDWHPYLEWYEIRATKIQSEFD